MPRAISEEDRPTEDDIAREKLGPRGVPGEPSPTKNDAAAAKRKRRNPATSTGIRLSRSSDQF